jgi:hydrogenase maturation factor
MELGVSILGGHTEVTPSLKHPIVVTSCFGFTDRFYTSDSARPGDQLAMTKSAGIEGTAILAGLAQERSLKGRSESLSKRYLRRMSITREAQLAASRGAVHAMHDATEGGVLGAAVEMATASKVGVAIEKSKIPVSNETQALCRELRVDPLKLVSSGVLLLAVDKRKSLALEDAFYRHKIRLSFIGEFTKAKGSFLEMETGKKLRVGEIVDEIWRFQEMLKSD